MKAKKVVLIGIDGATWKLMRPFIKKGSLPYFADIIKKGCSGSSESTIPPLTSPALPAMYTSLNPGSLGLWSFSKKGKPVILQDIKKPTIWKYLNDSGKKCLVFNFPLTYPVSEIDGIMVSGYPVPDKDSDFVFPGSLKKEFDFPMDIINILENDEFVKIEKHVLLKKQKSITKKRIDIFKRLMKKDDFDLSMIFIKGTDILQHYLWDENSYMEEYYRFIDKELSDMVKTVKSSNVIIFSDHGFDAVPRFDINMNTFLIKEGYLVLSGGKVRRRAIKMSYLLLNKFVPRGIRKILFNSVTKKRKETPGRYLPGVDWESTSAFKDKFGISISERLGKDEYEKTRDDIIEKIKNMKNNQGDHIIKEVYKREELYSGSYTDDSPDIIPFLHDNYNLSPASRFSSKIIVPAKRGVITGAHNSDREGIFIAYGPDIKSGKKTDIKIFDITPTILHICGVPVPHDIDGRVLKEIFKLKDKVRFQESNEMESVRNEIENLRKLGKL